MNRTFQLLIIFIIPIFCYSQAYTPGRIITIDNDTIYADIKYNGWYVHPERISFKKGESDKVSILELHQIKEINIADDKFISVVTEIETTSDILDNLTQNPEFQLETDTLLLKEIFNYGDKTLFVHSDFLNDKNFYIIYNNEITLLKYKRYIYFLEQHEKRPNMDQHSDVKPDVIKENNHYKGMLSLYLEDLPDIQRKLSVIEYNQNDLLKLFKKYAAFYWKNNGGVQYESNVNNCSFHISCKLGLNLKDMVLRNSYYYISEIDFNKNFTLTYGIETEYILPGRNQKWSITAEPTYQYYNEENSQETKKVSGGIHNTTVSYHSIEIPVGVRRYFYINNNSKIFANISTVFNITNDSFIEFTRDDASVIDFFNIVPSNNFGFGVGYKSHDKYSLEIRYQTIRNVLSDRSNWNSEYETIAIILGYRLF